jgi:hypothetical protein
MPMSVMFALVDAGGVEAVAGHLRAVRRGWASAHFKPDLGEAGAAATIRQVVDEGICVVHYVLEGMPRAEKERAIMLRQHAPRSVDQTGQSNAAKKRGATVRSELFERALLWLGVEASGVVVHHTESPAASMDYLGRLIGKLFVRLRDNTRSTAQHSTARAHAHAHATTTI